MKKKLLESCIALAQKKVKETQALIDEKIAAMSELPLARPGDYESIEERARLFGEINELTALLGRIEVHLSFLENLSAGSSPTNADLGSLVIVKDCQTGNKEVFLIVTRPEVFCVRPLVGEHRLCCISPHAPFCKIIWGREAGARFQHQDQEYEVVQIE